MNVTEAASVRVLVACGSSATRGTSVDASKPPQMVRAELKKGTSTRSAACAVMGENGMASEDAHATAPCMPASDAAATTP
ncbi:hypothetical protein SB761_30340, partial [Pseudomonas sp. SIMBA_064]